MPVFERQIRPILPRRAAATCAWSARGTTRTVLWPGQQSCLSPYRGDAKAAWRLYKRLVCRAWAGQVKELIAALEDESARLGQPPPKASNDDPRRIVWLTLEYIKANAHRMDYARYRTWQKLGRQVCTGERGIMIFAPCPWKRETETETGETETEQGIYFKAVHVFDVAQTDGDELPTVNRSGLFPLALTWRMTERR